MNNSIIYSFLLLYFSSLILLIISMEQRLGLLLNRKVSRFLQDLESIAGEILQSNINIMGLVR